MQRAKAILGECSRRNGGEACLFAQRCGPVASTKQCRHRRRLWPNGKETFKPVCSSKQQAAAAASKQEAIGTRSSHLRKQRCCASLCQGGQAPQSISPLLTTDDETVHSALPLLRVRHCQATRTRVCTPYTAHNSDGHPDAPNTHSSSRADEEDRLAAALRQRRHSERQPYMQSTVSCSHISLEKAAVEGKG